MTERRGEHGPDPDPLAADRTGWDVGRLSRALDREPELVRDPAWHVGVRYTLGELEVAVFPPNPDRRGGVVRFSTADLDLTLFRQAMPAIRAEGLIFETNDHFLSLSPGGELMLHRALTARAPVAPSGPSANPEWTNGADGDDEGRSGDSVAPPRGFQAPLPESNEGQPRVQYGGRLGTEPRTKTTPRGKFVMEFPVAVKVEGQDKADWRNTIVFDERARKLEADGTLHRGVYVDVVAYEHAKLRKGQDGKTREVKEYYATSVTPKVRNRSEADGARDGQRP